ncbi:hypothetical protein PLICRDRAFT_37851 [Plicaturopsis crispa FD-325 SS-3]|nr:hypothetical protein PLICRDRAFT_37851 [Plicaturopsis crispa FD-325 SS-3]
MIVDKHSPPDDETSSDPPPSYDDTVEQTLPRTSYSTDVKSTPHAHTQSQSPTVPTSPGTPPGVVRATRPKSKGWFSFGASRTKTEVRSTTLGLVRDLVRQEAIVDAASAGIIASCGEACAAHNLSFSALLQEPSIEGHTPMYWAIVKRPPALLRPPPPDDRLPLLLDVLLDHAAPLTPGTVADIRHACLLAADEALFQRLRRHPQFSPLSGTEEMLWGAAPPWPRDDVRVEEVPGDHGAFVVHFALTQFQRRMRVAKQVGVEFIARARMWKLVFCVDESGAWSVALSIMTHSAPTYIDSRLLIDAPPPTPSVERKPKPKPTISLRLNSGSSQLSPLPNAQDTITVQLQDSMMGPTLQYENSPYLLQDGTLVARLEARLAKPEADCVIC